MSRRAQHVRVRRNWFYWHHETCEHDDRAIQFSRTDALVRYRRRWRLTSSEVVGVGGPNWTNSLKVATRVSNPARAAH